MHPIICLKVAEKLIVVEDSIDKTRKIVPEYSIYVKSTLSNVKVIRYVPDFHSFDDLVKVHYPKIKLPTLNLRESITKADKRRSLRDFFHRSVKSNIEKVEKYLYRCSADPVLRTSTLWRDFLSPQRDGDFSQQCQSSAAQQQQQQPLAPSSRVNSLPSPAPSSDTSAIGKKIVSLLPQKEGADDPIEPDTDVSNHSKAGELWTPSPQLSIISLPQASDDDACNVDLVVNSRLIFIEDCNEEEDDDLLEIMVRKQESQDDSMQDNRSPLDHLDMIKVLGKGCMGKVLLVRSRITQQLYALKSIVKAHVVEQKEIAHTLDERNILVKLTEIEHPYLAKLHASFQDEHRLYLLSNYYCGGDLATHMAKLYNFPPECALFYAAEMIDGIGELHKWGILYRDLKPENILLTGDGHVILTDFGLSKWLDKNDNYTTQTFCGTAEYLAPEVLLGEHYSFGIDHWSFGTILYEMLAGVTPFWAENHSDMYKRVLDDPLEFPADIFDYETADFLTGLLDRDPSSRLGANGVEEIKSHIYFSGISWNDVRLRRLQPPFVPPVKYELDFTNFDSDFLAMTPALTPATSQFDFIEEVQSVFDGYSFADSRYRNNEQLEQPYDRYKRQLHHEDGFYNDNDIVEQEIIETNGEEDTRLANPLPIFQTARKRGSISMLSDDKSFRINHCSLQYDTMGRSSYSIISNFKDEENARYAKRRNTKVSLESNKQNEIEDLSEYPTTLVVRSYEMNNGTTATNSTSETQYNNNNKSTITFLSVEIAEFSHMPDLKLAFDVQQQQQQQQQQDLMIHHSNDKQASSSNSSKISISSKARRFFSLIL
ncbi:kinase-like domain-containing protein [Mycotypha africana]|uniref:kinase-like domain-containing protein n=1 Tax=Mycotypha africana TaxID=64632 RepID=UPI002301939C|nr:kinase-like domain-containing protein [Mycotypha africana]KAI8975241.1 kinase-like domain-containing protein [Mycotypha africana]